MFSILGDQLYSVYRVLAAVFGVLVDYYFLWLPIFLGGVFVKVWLNYIQTDFLFNQKYFLIEIKLPREIMKTPLAMETFLYGLWFKPTSTYIDTYWEGKVQPWFSLELVSIGGQVRYYIWGWEKYRRIAEAQLYAQYPDVEIYEAQDYTENVVHDLNRFFIWGTYFKLTQKDVYPIKTYVDYGLDRENVEEEVKTDPMTGLIEYLGSMRPHEQVWIQILIQGHQRRSVLQGQLFPSKDWTEEAKREIQKIRDTAAFGPSGFPLLTKGQNDKIAAIERSIGKYAFDTIIRAFYVGPPGPPDPAAIPGLIYSLRQFSSNFLNGFKLGWFTDFDYPWMDFMRIRRTYGERQMLRAYKLRSGFQIPFKNFHTQPFILTTEELATLYHFPGRVARTPSLPRIESRRSEAPPNLPA